MSTSSRIHSHHPIALALILAWVALPTLAMTTHVADGMLPGGWPALWWALSLPLIGWGLRQTRLEGERDARMRPMSMQGGHPSSPTTETP